jgi:hypothetical protein
MTHDELPSDKPSKTRVHTLTNGCFDPKKYEYDFSFKESSPDNFWGAHTTIEMLRALDYNPKIELDAKVLCANKEGDWGYRNFNTKSFRETFVKNNKSKTMRENYDAFARYQQPSYGAGLVGQDFTPFLGGPFFKNQYYWNDYIRMHSECFYAYHYDPIAKAFMNITRDFVIGSGYDIQCDTSTRKGQIAMATWKAFEETNNLVEQIDQLTIELGVYGETMLWWLPNNEAKITYQLKPGDTNPLGIIPRVRLIDPSNIIEIITYPEDITRKLAYIWLTPTQYQIYTTAFDVKAAGEPDEIQPTLKYIYRQIPAAQMMHYKVNAVSNEKRGRSDFFPILGYLKRLRDTVEYSIISLQKNSSWSIDTTIDGDQADIDNYIRSMNALGTIPPAGSDFVHSKQVTREYRGNSGTGGDMSNTFEWVLSMCCAGITIPFNYLGTHLSGGSTRASAIVATEPVAKKMENRQKVIKRILKDCWDRLMKETGLGKVDCHIIFPEIITQDRSQKLKDLTLAESNQWLSPERCATIAAKEFGIQDYKYQEEMKKYAAEKPEIPAVLTGAPQQTSSPFGSASTNDADQESAITQDERKAIKSNGSTL